MGPRWLMTLLCVALFCTGLYLLVDGTQRVQIRQNHLRQLELRKNDLEHWRAAHLRLQAQVAEWNQVWEQARAAGLDPNVWQEHPVRVQGDYAPHQVSQIVQLLSDDVKTGNAFWFVPQTLTMNPTIRDDPGNGEDRDGQASQPALFLHLHGKVLTRF